ncbi:MAG TPA: D-glycero-beta-D-manno-heptose 1,7-bisphosphate 7-phosphatase [Cycloclasticus sp.]|nr:D-glycero-beta-D-manno-heptose 1,7-bisphosphate 7-phosphatase [Cycloclasticus sp.]
MDIILDRDGVINLDSDAYVKNADEWIPIKSSIDAIALLHQAGHRVFVATNQSGVGRGYFSLETLAAMHEKMLSLVNGAGGQIIDIAFCPHSPEDACDCRKPKSGLLTSLSIKNNIQLEQAIVIGDSLRDLQAAIDVQATPLLVLTGKGKKTQQQHPDLNVSTFENLYDAVQHIIA